MKEYLTEQNLKQELKSLFPSQSFIHNKSIPYSDFPYRPDFRCEDLKLIIEFDGFRHYTKSKTIFSDYEKDYLWTKEYGYKVIRIPYFIQLCTDVLLHEFELKKEFKQVYPHGFVDKSACLPADFCEQGYNRFERDLERFDYLYNDVVKSLNDKVVERNEPYTVVPSAFEWPNKFYNNDSRKIVKPHALSSIKTFVMS